MAQWCRNLLLRNRGASGFAEHSICVVPTKAWGDQSQYGKSHSRQLIFNQDGAGIASGWQDHQKPWRLEMARLRFSIKLNFQCKSGCHTPWPSCSRSEDLQADQRMFQDWWPSGCLLLIDLCFNSISIIFNHLMPAHRDGKSRNQWYDLLVTLGRYQSCNLELPGLDSYWNMALVQ